MGSQITAREDVGYATFTTEVRDVIGLFIETDAVLTV